jgi:hypothetical protein
MSGLPVDRDNLRDKLLEKDVNAAIRRILCEVDMAAAQDPVTACHPYIAESRRKAIVRAVWQVFRRVAGRGNRDDTE